MPEGVLNVYFFSLLLLTTTYTHDIPQQRGCGRRGTCTLAELACMRFNRSRLRTKLPTSVQAEYWTKATEVFALEQSTSKSTILDNPVFKFCASPLYCFFASLTILAALCPDASRNFRANMTARGGSGPVRFGSASCNAALPQPCRRNPALLDYDVAFV